MKAEEFSKEYQRLSDEIDRLMKEQSELKDNYLIENWQFQPGDAVKIISPTENVNVFVSRAYVVSDGEIKYSFIRMKKDGTPSVNKYYPDFQYKLGGHMELELIHSEYRNKNFDGTPIEQE